MAPLSPSGARPRPGNNEAARARPPRLTEFEDDPEAVEALLDAAQSGRFDHVAQRLRDDREDANRRAAFVAHLAEQGLTVVDEPSYADWTPVRRLSRLTDADGHDLTPENHAACPGHAAYVSTAWRSPDDVTDTDHTVTDKDDDYEDDEADAEDQDCQPSWQPPFQVLVAGYVCTDAAATATWTAGRPAGPATDPRRSVRPTWPTTNAQPPRPSVGP